MNYIIIIIIIVIIVIQGRPIPVPHGLERVSAAARLLGMHVRLSLVFASLCLPCRNPAVVSQRI